MRLLVIRIFNDLWSEVETRHYGINPYYQRLEMELTFVREVFHCLLREERQ